MNFTKENSLIMLYSIIIAVIFFLIIMPYLEKSFNLDKMAIRENLENILNKAIFPIDQNKCSRSCCRANTSWPVPKELLENDIDSEELKMYVPNNFSCTDGPTNKSGCLCMTQKDMDYLTNKAGNSSH